MPSSFGFLLISSSAVVKKLKKFACAKFFLLFLLVTCFFCVHFFDISFARLCIIIWLRSVSLLRWYGQKPKCIFCVNDFVIFVLMRFCSCLPSVSWYVLFLWIDCHLPSNGIFTLHFFVMFFIWTDYATFVVKLESFCDFWNQIKTSIILQNFTIWVKPFN